MNFLAHYWLADRARLPLAGALLGDVLRGALPAQMPDDLARSVALHRRIDATTDRHPRVVALRATYPAGARRYSGILMDLLFDHVLARDWVRYSTEPLPAFAGRAARDTHAARAWFEHAGGRAPQVESFSGLLQSYATPAGIERAIERTARRLRVPGGLLDAAAGWPERLPALERDLPVLLEDLAACSAESTKV